MWMRVAWVTVACGIAGGCLSPVVHFGEGKSARQSQHDIASEHVAPTTFERSHDFDGRVTPVRIRVWADDAYRAQNVRWQQSFADELEHANDVLGGLFGIRLVAELRSWSRAAPGATLADSLQALAQVDPGDDVLTVVGLTSSLPLVAASFEQLGLAEVGGRHMMLRGYADLEERKVFDRVFTELRSDERELIYQARRRHKTTAILLHELGHNLGAEHPPDEDTLMHASYSEHASRFDAHSREVILATLDRQRSPGQAAAAPARGGPAAHRASEPAVAKRAALVIDLDPEGRVSADGSAVSDAQLDALLADTAQGNRSAEVLIRYGKRTPRDAVNAVLERVQAAGLRASFGRN